VEQHAHHLLAHARRLEEGLVELLARGLGARAQHAPLGDGRQVAVFERDGVEARLPVLEHVGETELLRARHVLAHQFAQVTLARHEAAQRHGPIGRLRLHQLGELLALAVDEGELGRLAGQPQNQLVEEQHHGVVAQRLRVPADDREPLVQLDKAVVLRNRQALVGGEVRLHQRARASDFGSALTAASYVSAVHAAAYCPQPEASPAVSLSRPAKNASSPRRARSPAASRKRPSAR
jgi:hypothetical protein